MSVVIMPKMGDAMEEGTLLKWLKSTGDEVAEGDALAEIETDKVTLELEAAESGFLTNTLVDEGAVVPIGTPVATIGAQDEIGKGGPASAAPAAEPDPAAAEAASEKAVEQSAPEPAAVRDAAPSNGAAPKAEAASSPATTQVVSRAPDERIRASPLVKRLAAEHGIDLAVVAGTGPGGRIIKNDINDFVSGAKPIPQAANAPAEATPTPAQAAPAAAPSSGAAPKGKLVELARIRRTTGERMALSKREIPHFYVTSDVDMTAALDFRKQINATLEAEGTKVTINDVIVKAAALALRDNPTVNASFVDGQLYQLDAIDINIAVSLDGGLIAPYVPSADGKSLGSIARITRDLSTRARNGGLTPDEYQGGSFTISNLGMFDVDEFVGVINPPQAAILAVASAREVPVVRDGEIAIGSMVKLTVSADHRALDGAEVAKFLQAVRKYLENPMLLAVS